MGVVTRLFPGPVDSYFQHSLLTYMQLEADTLTGKLTIADCWTGWTRRQQLQTYASQPDGPLKGAGRYSYM